MTLLPVVERELRVMARRKSTYRLRFFIALIALGLLLIFMATERGFYSGKGLFITMSVLVFVFCLLSGILLTADSLSGEKRAGTLGLLFLTDLRGYDIVLGKLTASSLHGFYALLGVFPILGISLILGGVTGGEFFRITAALVVAICFSLGCGLVVSATSKEIREVTIKTFLLIVAFSATGPLINASIEDMGGGPRLHFLVWFSPAGAFALAFDEMYSTGPFAGDFWWSLAFVAVIAGGLITLASLRLPKLWQEQPKSAPAKVRFPNPLRALQSRWFKRPLLSNTDPFLWLGIRDTSSRALSWIAVSMMIPLLCALVLAAIFGEGIIPKLRLLVWSSLVIAFCAHQFIKYLVALEGCRRLCEGRLSGALELHLTTPVSELQILKSSRAAVIKQFRTPIICIALANLVAFECLLLSSRSPARGADFGILSMSLVGGTIVLFLDCWALAFLGQWRGLRAKDSSRAVAGSLAWIFGLPWIFAVIVFGSSTGGPSSELSSLGIWFIFCISIGLMSGWSARSFLVQGIRPVLEQE